MQTQENSTVRSWNGFRTPLIYPAEITTSYNFQPRVRPLQCAPNLNQDERLLLTHEEKPGDCSGKKVMEENQQSTDFPKNSRAVKKHTCDECQRSFATVASFRKHHHRRKEFACKHCDKTYVSLGALKMHIRTHTLPCKCTVCGKAFSRPWLLQGHIRTHTGEKPYQCPKCQRAFADRSNLRAHLQTHSAVKKYCCSKCTRSFSRMSLLHKHQYTCGGDQWRRLTFRDSISLFWSNGKISTARLLFEKSC